MKNIAYGYKIKNGDIVIDEKEKDDIKTVFNNYILGMSLLKSAEKTGIIHNHSSIKRILKNDVYLGNEVYPKIIEREVFAKAQVVLNERSKSIRLHTKRCKKIKIPYNFKFSTKIKSYNNPFKEAEYLYTLIESESYVNE